jgi:hypothetical protein
MKAKIMLMIAVAATSATLMAATLTAATLTAATLTAAMATPPQLDQEQNTSN